MSSRIARPSDGAPDGRPDNGLPRTSSDGAVASVAQRAGARTPEPYVIRDGLAVYRLGSGPPVLLMPGPHRFQQPGDNSAAPLIQGLHAIGRQVISFDAPGVARSSRPARLTMDEMLVCADAALDLCGVRGPVDALGHSMGGLVTLAWAVARPARVRALVLIGTGTGGRAYMRAPGAMWHRGHPAFWGVAALGMLHTAARRRATEKLLNNWIDRHSYVDPTLAIAEPVVRADWWRPAVGRTDWHQRVARAVDYGPRLAEITAPTLVVCGRHDPQFALSCSRELAARIPQAQLVRLDRSGHSPHEEQPEACWTAVAAFLADDAA